MIFCDVVFRSFKALHPVPCVLCLIMFFFHSSLR